MADALNGTPARQELVHVIRQVRSRWRMRVLLQGGFIILLGALAAIAIASYGLQTFKFSPQSVTEHEDFAAAHGFAFPLLADEDKAVGKAYGIFNEERGMDARSAFVLDAQGVIRYSQVYAPGTIPESKELLEQLQKI